MQHARAILIVAMLACAPSAQAETIAGRAIAIDGATLEIAGQRVRLAGIVLTADDHVCARTDDERWRCGPRALNALDALLEEAVVACTLRETDAPHRVAACAIGPVDLSLWLLRGGLAQATQGAPARYRQAEAEARAARRGMWASEGERR